MKAFKKNICIEEFISRIPGLFPYLSTDEFGNTIKHKATDSVDGCYGKIIPDIEVDGKYVPYRTLIRDYYENGANAEIVERYIGKFRVSDFSEFEFQENATLVPEYIYAAEAKNLLDEMYRLKEACIAYSKNTETYLYGLCCECERYKSMGGQTMIDLLTYLIGYAEDVAEEANSNSDNDASYGFFINLSGSYEDMGYFTPYMENGECELGTPEFRRISEDNDYTVSYGKPYYVNVEDPSETITKEEYNALGDDEKENYHICGIVSTDSKLKSLRCFTTYINTRDKYEEPEEGEDWLYFYQKGYVANYETVNDENGNIMTIDDADKVTVDGYVTNLLAYGSLITDIEYDETEKTIIFTYYINAHLKAKLCDGCDNMYEFPFEYESGGVKQTETYYYAEGGELDNLISSGDFEKYVSIAKMTDDEGHDVIIPRKFETRKCAFSTMGSTLTYTKRIWDNITDVAYQQSNLEFERDNDYSVCKADIFKEDYLMGVHFQPEVDNKVNIRRGNNAAFERHIRLGEVKTLEDMENYMNGSFFNIQQIV